MKLRHDVSMSLVPLNEQVEVTMGSSVIVYRGPSEIDGAPIMGVVTMSSVNKKTGNMAQLWILRADIDPVSALREGKDSSVCGSCPFRGHNGKQRKCYVTVFRSPQQIYRSAKDTHVTVSPYELVEKLRDIGTTAFRWGAYGDPLALPLNVLSRLSAALREAGIRCTGYTHRWERLNQEKTEWARENLMASTDGNTKGMAKRLGYREFCVSTVRPEGYVECLASNGGTTCLRCGLCDGTGANNLDIWIAPHGVGKNQFKGQKEPRH